MTRTKCQQPEEGENRSRDALHTEPWVLDLIVSHLTEESGLTVLLPAYNSGHRPPP